MAVTETATTIPELDEAQFEGIIEQDPHEPGRHNARFVEHGTHLWAVLGSYRRLGENIRETAKEWRMPEETIEAAVRYYELHRDLFDAYFLLEREEWEAENGRDRR